MVTCLIVHWSCPNRPTFAFMLSTNDNGVAKTVTWFGTPFSNWRLTPLFVKSEVVLAHVCMKVMPTLSAWDPVTYDAANRALYWWLALCPYVCVRFPQLIPVERSVYAGFNGLIPGCVY